MMFWLLPELQGEIRASIAAAVRRFKQSLAKLQKALAAAFPALRTIRFPRAHHPIATQGAGPKPKVGPSKGGTEISAEVCQRLGVPRPGRLKTAPPAVKIG